MGQEGEVCEYINGCESGLLCVSGVDFPVPGGCTPLCDLGDPSCPQDFSCLPFYAEGEEPPGYADVGVCAIPE